MSFKIGEKVIGVGYNFEHIFKYDYGIIIDILSKYECYKVEFYRGNEAISTIIVHGSYLKKYGGRIV